MTETRPMPGPRHAPRSRLSSLGWRKLAAFLILLAVSLFVAEQLGEVVADRTATAGRAQHAGVVNGQQAVAGQNLAQQVHAQCLQGGTVARQLGSVCVQASVVAAASPTPVPGVDRTIIPGPQGVQGLQGIPGLPGAPGPTGPSGRTVTGPPGPDGLNGQGGLPGQPGTSVTGPPGPAGPAGASGANGSDGASGVNGQPPQSFTFTYVDTLGITRTETCQRNTPFDPTQPQYTCQMTS